MTFSVYQTESLGYLNQQELANAIKTGFQQIGIVPNSEDFTNSTDIYLVYLPKPNCYWRLRIAASIEARGGATWTNSSKTLTNQTSNRSISITFGTPTTIFFARNEELLILSIKQGALQKAWAFMFPNLPTFYNGYSPFFNSSSDNLGTWTASTNNPYTIGTSESFTIKEIGDSTFSDVQPGGLNSAQGNLLLKHATRGVLIDLQDDIAVCFTNNYEFYGDVFVSPGSAESGSWKNLVRGIGGVVIKVAD